MAFVKTYLVITFIPDAGVASICIVSLGGKSRRFTMAVDQLNCSLKCSVQHCSWRSWVDQWSDSSIISLTHGFRGPMLPISRLRMRLSLACGIFNLRIVSYPLPLAVIPQIFDRLTSQGFASFISCGIRGNGLTKSYQINWSRGYQSFLSFT